MNTKASILTLAILLLAAIATSASPEADSLHYSVMTPDFKVKEFTAKDLDLHAVAPDTAYLPSLRHTMLNDKKVSLYALPYSTTLSIPNWKRMWINTGTLFTAGFAALGVLELLPDGATDWNKARLHQTPPMTRWWDHVKVGPHWDRDNPIFNYILHPYGGAAYYMSARSQGFNVKQSMVYSFMVSTFFWEYGIEAFMEIPSIQDLIITPVVGSVVGEFFYKGKRKIVENGYTLLGSRFLGGVAAFVLDPVNEFVGLFAGNDAREVASYYRAGRHNSRKVTVSSMPMFSPNFVGLSVVAVF